MLATMGFIPPGPECLPSFTSPQYDHNLNVQSEPSPIRQALNAIPSFSPKILTRALPPQLVSFTPIINDQGKAEETGFSLGEL